MRVVRRAWEASDKVVTLNRNIPRPCCMHRWLLTLQNMACSTFRGATLKILHLVFKIMETSWVVGLIWDFINSLTLQSTYWIIHCIQLFLICEPPLLMFPELLQCHWWRSWPRLQSYQQAAAVLQKTMQIWEVACSKIICKVRTLQCCSDSSSQPGELCFVRCDLYLDFKRYCIKNGMIGREGPESSLIQNEMNIWVWYDFEVHICGRINTKRGWI